MVGKTDAKFCGQETGRDDCCQGGEINIAQSILREIGAMQPVVNVPEGSEEGDGEADSSRCADSLMHRDIAPDHKGYG